MIKLKGWKQYMSIRSKLLNINAKRAVFVLCLVSALCIPGYVSAQYHRNDCLSSFYLDTPNDTAHSKFRMVKEAVYRSDDSLMHNSKVTETTLKLFNKAGQKQLAVTTGPNGKPTDSTVYEYNNANDEVREEDWESDDSDVLIRSTYEIWVYDSAENEIKDSEYIQYDLNDAYFRESLSKYDTSGNEIESREFKERNGEMDTDIYWRRYNENNREVYVKEKSMGNYSQTYYAYNAKGQKVFSADTYGEFLHGKNIDSSWSTFAYNNKGVLSEENDYKKGKLCSTYTLRYGAHKEEIETSEDISTADPYSCSNNVVKVKVTDSTGKELSEVITREKDGKPIVTTIIHKYTFGETYIDSTFIVEQGFMYKEKWKEITTRVTDTHGNTLLFMMETGTSSGREAKDTWRYNDLNKAVYHAYYGSCKSSVPETETFSSYYPDGKSIKETIELSVGGYRGYFFYDIYGRMEKKKSSSKDSETGKMEYYVTYYEYK